MRFQLRPYQQKTVDQIRAEFARGCQSVLLVKPTGSGKTVTFAHIAESAGAKGNKVLTIAHRKELIRQCSLALGNLSVGHRIVAPKEKIAEIRRAHVAHLGESQVSDREHVAVASVQTLARRLEWLQHFAPALLIVDEAHHATAGTWRRILDALPDTRVLGVTATPCRTDGTGLGEIFDTMVEGPSMADLVEWGNLVPTRIFSVPLRASLDGVRKSKGDYKAEDMANVLDSKSVTGDAVEHYRKHANGAAAIVFCVNIKHAEHVAEAFQQAGFDFRVIHGGQDDSERDKLIYGLADGSVQGLVSVDVISEGTDIPIAEVAILLRATESEMLYLQQVGRVMRPAPGKDYGLILDHVGNVLRHGRPEAERAWTLQGKQQRAKVGESSEPGFRIQQCPECYIVHEPAEVCPECGHVYPQQQALPSEREGELEELEETEHEKRVREERLQRMREQGKAQTVDDMVNRLGYSRKRAEKILEARKEKEQLQRELQDLVTRWCRHTGRTAVEGWGFSMSAIRTMKPKELRTHIENIGHDLFFDGQKREQRSA